ncbi:phospholipase A1-like [Anthonomus grandis grandis]|uniref:phospholipase A1-like n=1 Tax=Anthonomus grandis grandis TaxID=2921223 RepID=UPI0021657542|nr:phospholipase A1-like [Anthonomus grandis grandis]
MKGLVVFLLFVSSGFSFPDLYNSEPYFQLLEWQNTQLNYDEVSTKYTLKVDKQRLWMYVYTRQDLAGTRISLDEAHNITHVSSFNTSKPTYIYTHGWTTKYTSNDGVQIREAILNTSEVNVLLYDWDYCATNIIYTTAWGCVEEVGNYLGSFLTELSDSYGYSLEDVTLIGHSLGAHISGYAGKATNGTLPVIVGLDPAGPLFFEDQPNHRLNATDAKYVQVIHTSAILIGLNYNVGVADFWPNGGHIQNGCEAYAIEFGRCSHIRAFMYYAESVLLNDFQGQVCDSYEDFAKNKCSNNEKGYMGGINVDTSLKGVFYLKTNSQSPYGQGDL